MTTHKQLRALGKSDVKKEADTSSVGSSECSICLMSIAVNFDNLQFNISSADFFKPCQSLFVAPCSHVWHYKCIRPILNNQKTYPQFLCPNCRAVADLEADIDDQYNVDDWNEEDGGSSPDEAGEVSGDNPEAGTTEQGTEPETERLATEHALLEETAPQPGTPVNLVCSRSSSNLRLGIAQGSSSGANAETTEYGFPNVVDDAKHEDNATPGVLNPNPSEILAGNEGPLTPRNDVGPFIFDGSAGRETRRRPAAHLAVVNDDAPPSVVA